MCVCCLSHALEVILKGKTCQTIWRCSRLHYHESTRELWHTHFLIFVLLPYQQRTYFLVLSFFHNSRSKRNMRKKTVCVVGWLVTEAVSDAGCQCWMKTDIFFYSTLEQEPMNGLLCCRSSNALPPQVFIKVGVQVNPIQTSSLLSRT